MNLSPGLLIGAVLPLDTIWVPRYDRPNVPTRIEDVKAVLAILDFSRPSKYARTVVGVAACNRIRLLRKSAVYVMRTLHAFGVLALTERDTWSATLGTAKSPGEWYLKVRHRTGPTSSKLALLLGILPSADLSSEPAVLEGDAARRALATLLPYANGAGATKRRIREAVDALESALTVDQLIYNASALGKAPDVLTHSNPLTRLPAPVRLGLEMVLHEDDERRAMEGELAILEARWREAEEIAAIADSLLIPADILDRIGRQAD